MLRWLNLVKMIARAAIEAGIARRDSTGVARPFSTSWTRPAACRAVYVPAASDGCFWLPQRCHLLIGLLSARVGKINMRANAANERDGDS
jgi:hypothetical protein